MQKGDTSSQTEITVAKCCETSTQNDCDDESNNSSALLFVERIQDYYNAIKFYNGFLSF